MPINPLLEESSYGCKVLYMHNMSYEMRKVRRYTEWTSMPYNEKARNEEFQVIITMAHIANIPRMIVDDALRYHKKIGESNTSFRGDNRDSIIAASIYLSCRIHEHPRTAKEIAQMFNLDVGRATKGCRNALAIINQLENNLDCVEKTTYCNIVPKMFVERYCSALELNTELTHLCMFISNKVHCNELLPENTPHAVAASIIYFIGVIFQLHMSKKDVRNISDVSEVTINKCFKRLYSQKNELIPAKLLEKYPTSSLD